MLSRWLRLGLVLSALLGLGSCELNPQPDLPGSNPYSPGAPATGSGGTGLHIGMGPMAGTGSVVAPGAGGNSGGTGGAVGGLPLEPGGAGGEAPIDTPQG